METTYTNGTLAIGREIVSTGNIPIILEDSGSVVAFAASPKWQYEETIQDEKATPANAARLVACWNACDGMDDPAAEIAKLRADNERMQRKLSQCAMYCNAQVHEIKP